MDLMQEIIALQSKHDERIVVFPEGTEEKEH